jgi:integrase
MSSLTVMKSSVNTYYRHIRAAFNQAVAWGYLKASPCQGVKEARVQACPPRYLSREEINRLLAAEQDTMFRSLWLFMLLTGCRRMEALQIQAKDVNLERKQIAIRETKTRAAKVIIITPALEPILQGMPQVGRWWPWHPGHVSARFKQAARSAGITCRLHDLRHTFASLLVMAGVGLYTVKDLLGHANINTTQRYAHLSDEHLWEALGKLQLTNNQKATNGK